MRRAVPFVLALCLAPAMPSAAQTAAASPGWTAYVEAVDRFAAADSVVGGGTVLLRDGRVLARHDFGLADRDRGQRTDTATIYHWASITKTLTAVAILQLRDRGLLSLDDPVTRWIPELRRMHDPWNAMDSVTVRMLLSHSAGFQNPTWPYDQGKPWEPFEPTRWEQLLALMPYQELHFRPGSRFGYSNPAFIYLARILEEITGDPYQGYVHKNLWTPLGMTRSYFGATPWHLARDRSDNYTLRRDSAGTLRTRANGRDFDPGITIPNGGWNAPLGDLVTWVEFLSGRGDTTVLAPASLAEMRRTVVPVPADEDLGAAVGLSLFLFPDQGLVGQTGEQAGFRSYFYLDPATGTAVIAAYNTVNAADPKASAARWSAVNTAARTLVRSAALSAR